MGRTGSLDVRLPWNRVAIQAACDVQPESLSVANNPGMDERKVRILLGPLPFYCRLDRPDIAGRALTRRLTARRSQSRQNLLNG